MNTIISALAVFCFVATSCKGVVSGDNEFSKIKEATLIETMRVASNFSEGGIANWTSGRDHFTCPVVLIPHSGKIILISIIVYEKEGTSSITVGEVIERFELFNQEQLKERRQKHKGKNIFTVWLEKDIIFYKGIFKEKGVLKNGEVFFSKTVFSEKAN